MRLYPRMLVLACTMALGCGDDDDDGAVPDAMLAPDGAVAPVIVVPPDGSELRARRQEFEWTANGENYRLRIGMTPGAADVFDSGPLGDATSVVVDGLPLSGVMLHATLLSGPDDARVSSSSTYRSPIRRGLAVVVDFADKVLEDWDGPGVNSPDELAPQLLAMEDHWRFLARDLEKVQWDIVRVQLDQPLSDTAYPGWPEFREAIVTLARERILVADYDVDSDGVVDAIWAILATQGTDPPYALGGSSQNAGAYIFVDGQASLSLVGGHTGNFNHELAHTLEVPDLYGPFGTVGDLTVMSNSWALPPHDFTAFERIHLGWLDPVVVDRSTSDLVVPSAHDNLFALRVTTDRPDEYFLIEYRQRPESGYGSSSAADYDGLAIYHVFESSDQWTDPPFLKLEPADGVIFPDRAAEVNDFVSPDNPSLQRPLIVDSHFGYPLIEIDNVRWADGGAIAFDLVTVPPPIYPEDNLVSNPTVEAGTDGWVTRSFRPDATFTWAGIGADGSAHSLEIVAPTDNDAEWATTVTDLVPGRGYHACASLKGEDVVGGRGATIALSGTFTHSQGLFGTFDWTRQCRTIGADTDRIDLACRLGGFAATTSGTMWCDDVSLVLLHSAFAP